jgi:hypothetical protein
VDWKDFGPRYRQLGPGSRDDVRAGSPMLRLVAIIVVFVLGWVCGIWSQSSGVANSILVTLPGTESLRTALRLREDDSRMTSSRLAALEQKLERLAGAGASLAEEQKATDKRLTSMQWQLQNLASDVNGLRVRYDQSLDDISGDLGHLLDSLRREAGIRNSGKAEPR